MMVNLIGFSLELMTNTIFLVTQPFSLCARAICLVTHTWLQFMKSIVDFHVNLFRKIMAWAVAFVSLPVRILTALHRERMLDMHLHEMGIELENLAWHKKQLDERLQIVLKDRKILTSVLEELEEEHEKAIAKIELLENELQEMKDENLHLKEIRGKSKWDSKAQHDRANEKHGISFTTEYDEPPLKSGYTPSGVKIQDVLKQRDVRKEENRGRGQPQDSLKLESKSSELVCQEVEAYLLSVDEETLDQRREVAFSQSVFSATLSLLVGFIVWNAEDPCMPLVVALFTVVGMSLKSVVQFFSTIKNRPASDAVALLSFNWFILGTLTYPTLPKFAHVLIPLVISLADRILKWLGFPSLSQIE